MKKESIIITRRDFVRGTSGALLGVSLLNSIGRESTASPDSRGKVILIREKDIFDAGQKIQRDVLKTMLETCLLTLTGKKTIQEAWLSLVSAKDKIGLVPHLRPEHPEVHETIQKSLEDAGIPAANISNAFGRPERAESCTALINLPMLRTHRLTGMGTVFKNYIMFSGKPRTYHQEDNVKLGEVWNMPHVKGKTRLTIVDALYPVFEGGPQRDPRYMWRYNGLIAGMDPVAVETIGLKLIEARRNEFRGENWPLSPPALCVEAAEKKYKLGSSDMAKINLEIIGWKEGLLL